MLTSSVWRGPAKQSLVVAIFTIGLVVGGVTSALLLGMLAGVASMIPSILVRVGAMSVAVVAVGREMGFIQIPLPEYRRLVPKNVFSKGPRRSALQFGFELGTGVRTYVSSTAPYLLAFAIVFELPAPLVALIVGTGFGLGRSLMTWLRHEARDKDAWDHGLTNENQRISQLATLSIAAWLIIMQLQY